MAYLLFIQVLYGLGDGGGEAGAGSHEFLTPREEPEP